MARSIHLTWSSSPSAPNRIDAVRLRVDVTSAVQIPLKIFAYQSAPIRPSTGERVHMFDHVCSPVDLVDYPEDTPLPNTHPDWLRASFVDILLRSNLEAEAYLAKILEDVTSLKVSLESIDNLQPGGSVYIGEVTRSSLSHS
jgi:hypothetical protein